MKSVLLTLCSLTRVDSVKGSFPRKLLISETFFSAFYSLTPFIESFCCRKSRDERGKGLLKNGTLRGTWRVGIRYIHKQETVFIWKINDGEKQVVQRQSILLDDFQDTS